MNGKEKHDVLSESSLSTSFGDRSVRRGTSDQQDYYMKGTRGQQ